MLFEAQNFEDQKFKKAVCPGEDLSHKEFTKCVFEKCDFSGCKFSGTLFVECVFLNCNLTNIKIDDSGFRGVKFDNCKLLGVVFAEINTFIVDLAFNKCSIELCDFNRLSAKKSKFIECAIIETDFVDTNLSGSDFSGSDLRASKFLNTNFEKVDFRGAKNYYIDPTHNKLKGAVFSFPEVLGVLEVFGIKTEY